MALEGEVKIISDLIKFTVRLTLEQNEKAERQAKELNISKNQYIAQLIDRDNTVLKFDFSELPSKEDINIINGHLIEMKSAVNKLMKNKKE